MYIVYYMGEWIVYYMGWMNAYNDHHMCWPANDIRKDMWHYEYVKLSYLNSWKTNIHHKC